MRKPPEVCCLASEGHFSLVVFSDFLYHATVKITVHREVPEEIFGGRSHACTSQFD